MVNGDCFKTPAIHSFLLGFSCISIYLVNYSKKITLYLWLISCLTSKILSWYWLQVALPSHATALAHNRLHTTSDFTPHSKSTEELTKPVVNHWDTGKRAHLSIFQVLFIGYFPWLILISTAAGRAQTCRSSDYTSDLSMQEINKTNSWKA